ncbi:hypothetical protein VN97_g12098 [Penicillium thymicola]|uniref:NACHT domain-containing protein n=1 Tax=Penicillium thymicola TaxID=293382 RepID=A0AAI9T632_PENTH|nr:hypothetical protein VN97_g12098 [Penicillium thymicola]
MAYTTSYGGTNSGLQVGQNLGHITNQFLQSETSLNQACLRDLRTTNPHHDKDRIQNTNGGLLKDSYCWILDNGEFQQWQNDQSNCLLWIRGDPGKGKTMLLCGIIDELTRLFGNTANISFFFCQATDARINNATAVLRGLIYSLVVKQVSLLSHVKSQYDHAGKALFEDINAWNALSRIFTDILKDATLPSTYLIIDALDECTTGLPSLLDLITQISSAYPQIKWIVSSRNWPDIEERLDTTHTAPISLELNEASVSEAVSKFIQHKVHYLTKVKKYSDETRDTVCRHLSSNSQGTFLWVALVCQELDRIPRRHALKRLEAFPPGLNALYGRMIDQVHNSEDAESCKRILAVMSIVYRPIAFDELASLVELPNDLSNDTEALSEIIAICGSFLTVREDTIVFVHQSAKEFLLREMQNGVSPEGIEAKHHTIFSRSLQAMFKTLQRDIFEIKFPGFPIEEVIPPSPNPLAAAQYACVYWVDHLHYSGCHNKNDLSVDERWRVDDFLQKKYLHWLEALSILGCISQGIAAMIKLEGLIQEKGEPPALLCRVQDASRFIRYHKVAIESSPLQVYSSPLIFSPMLGLTRRSFQRERPGWVLNEPLVDKNWSPCLQTLEGHSDWVNSIAWSPDGSRLASASSDKTVRIWDPTTGQCASTLEGHSELVCSIAWSPDRSRLASGSADQTVRIWDPATSQCTSTLEGHIGWVNSIAWSPDGSRLASAPFDNSVMIWDPATGQCASTLEGHIGWVDSIAWSPDGSRLASASYKTVRIWDPATGQCVAKLKKYRNSFDSITWSQDGSRLTLASDKTVRIYDPATGRCTTTLKCHSDLVGSVAWSQDGGRLASVSADNTIRIWDLTTGQCASTLEGHSATVLKIAWSQDKGRLASASADNTIRIWDLATGQCASTLEGHSATVLTIAWSQDGNRLASASEDYTVRIWDPAIGQCASNLEGRSDPIRMITWSPDGSRLASASADHTVRIWDLATGQCASTLEGHSDWVNSIAWSPDRSRLTSASADHTVRIWDLATGQCASTLEGHSDWVNSIAWSPDRSRLTSASADHTVRIWDLAICQCTLIIEGHGEYLFAIAWSQDGSQLASVDDAHTVRIWDPTTGQCTFPVSSPGSVQWDKVSLNHLHTSIGKFDLGFIFAVRSAPHNWTLPDQYGYGLNDDKSWITYNGVNLLWLPAEYRPTYSSLFAISATNLAIACPSRIIFLTLTEHSPIPGL